ncbi:cyclodeaminase/cyclohydrolase family protein [Abyssisolibacter fermentans]|uniref:cyclodeaminase/cyclohydrolase family protein n=1 Tax=Abyssisolibacter fermentans TaxID=1766203 RepID=UPI00082D8D56|nr:cyclodeaminase/cyclohydrolase family protein [Abyssisolibacter fermentans]
MLIDLSIKEFIEETASDSPAPGGGSISALSGAIAVSLAEMVANLTVGKKKYEDVEDSMKEILEKGEIYRKDLTDGIDEDTDAFNKVMSAFKLPKNTDEDKELRKLKIQEAMKNAALVPLKTAQKSYEFMKYIKNAITKGNSNAVTDAAVAAMMARTAVLGALYNVKINLGSIKDEEFKEQVSKKVTELEENVIEMEKEILSYVKEL